MTRNPLRRRLQLFLLGLLALNLVVAGVWTVPRLLQERGILDRSEALRRDVERQRIRLQTLRARRDVVRANQDDARRLLGAGLESRSTGLLPVLEEVESAARSAGLELSSRSYAQEAVKALPVVQVRITLPVEGSYAQLVRFIDLLEHSKHFLAVDQVQLRDREGAREQLSIALSAYFHADAEASHGT